MRPGRRSILFAPFAPLNVSSIRLKMIDQPEVDTLDWIVKGGLDPNASDRLGRTLLMHAAMTRSVQTAALLIKGGARVDAADLRGMTPLMYAGRARSESIVRILLDAGADPMARDHSGRTALDHTKSGLRDRHFHITSLNVSVPLGRWLPWWTDPVYRTLRRPTRAATVTR